MSSWTGFVEQLTTPPNCSAQPRIYWRRARFVLEELGYPVPADFNQLWYLARERLGVHPNQVVGDSPGASQVRKILGASWTIAEQVNELRNLQGTGHGRTLPTGVSANVAMLVVREACSIAQFMLGSLDKMLGA